MRRKSFFKNLTVFMIPLLIPLIILGTFSITLTQTMIREDIDANNIKILSKTKETLELIFNELDLLSINFDLNPSVIIKVKNLLEGRLKNQEIIKTLDDIMNIINPPVNSKPYIQSLYIYYNNKNGSFFVSNLGIENLHSFIDKSWYKSFAASETDTWIEARETRLFSFEKDTVSFITLYDRLYSPGSQKADGVIVMNIKKDYIENILNESISYSDHIFLIIDANNNIIASTGNKSAIEQMDIKEINANPYNYFEYKLGSKKYIVSTVESERYSIKYVSVIPKMFLYKVPTQLLILTGFLVLISFLLGLGITYYNTRKNYARLNNIISAFESAEKGEPLPELPSQIKDEYGYILQNVVKTFIEQSYLKVQLSEKKYQLKAAEMMALQAQINPHFLFNTLKTIFWKSIALTGGQNEVSKMIEYLSEILNYSLSSSDELVTLSDEIKNTQCYIEIQKIRYRDKFGVIWQYDENITDYKVIKLLFQPFIENSIYHGIKEKVSPSYIKIKIKINNGIIKIAIIDNGIGIEPARLKDIREKLKEKGDYTEHIGLFNTNKRLKLMYGEEYGIKLRSKSGFGTVVYLDIPAVR
ncbi:MAG: histidine kinase [Clostridiaceae bacterium]|nr:histidine kinase [Clostridiaceae bacterium]